MDLKFYYVVYICFVLMVKSASALNVMEMDSQNAVLRVEARSHREQ